MSDNDQVDLIVETALCRLSLADPPPTLLPAVMDRVQALQPTPRFQLTWLDYALSLFAALMTGLFFWLWGYVPLLNMDRLQSNSLNLITSPQLEGVFLGGLLLVTVMVFIAARVLDRTEGLFAD